VHEETSEQNHRNRDVLRFLRQWLRHPGRTGSVTPSGAALAGALAAEVPATARGGGTGWVVELGPGTGCVTRALLAAGVRPERLVVVEYNEAFCGLLRTRFPEIHVVNGDACVLGQLLEDAGAAPIAAIVSSLPLLSLGTEVRHAILSQIGRVLGEDGVLVQYTYGLKPPVPLPLAAELGLAGTRTRRVFANLPPAAVWRYRHHHDDAAPALRRAA
jgi:phosphatidylethanolamine/phosphatidyl-N-methylethanolamine N-methyltransferase